MPRTVTAAPTAARAGTRSLRNTRPRGIAKIGAVDESTVATATPAYRTPATNRMELTAVSPPSARSRQRARGPCRLRATTPPHDHGVIHRRTAATGSRTACAWIASTSAREGLRTTTDAAHATDPSVAAPTPIQKRSRAALVDRVSPTTVRTTPPRVRTDPTANRGVSGSVKKNAASKAAKGGELIDTVMAPGRPRPAVASKNTVSPSQTARRTEMARRTNARHDIEVSPFRPPVLSTHARMNTPPSVDRTAFRETELNVWASERTSIPMMAQLRAQRTA